MSTLIERIDSLLEGRVTMWHGTSSKLAKGILSAGLIPDPAKKRWDASTGPKASLTGVYLTQNWRTADSYARHACEKFGGTSVIFQVRIETRSVVPDEENTPSPENFISPDHWYQNAWLVHQWYVSKKAQTKAVTAAVKKYKSYLSYLYRKKGKLDDRRWNSVRPLVFEYLYAYIRAVGAFHVEQAKAKGYDDPSHANIRTWQPWENTTPSLRKMQDNVSRKLKWLVAANAESGEAYNNNARSLTPISFRGANKIVNVVQIIDHHSSRVGSTNPTFLPPEYMQPEHDGKYELRAVFGEVSAEFLDNFKRSIGGEFVVTKGALRS